MFVTSTEEMGTERRRATPEATAARKLLVLAATMASVTPWKRSAASRNAGGGVGVGVGVEERDEPGTHEGAPEAEAL